MKTFVHWVLLFNIGHGFIMSSRIRREIEAKSHTLDDVTTTSLPYPKAPKSTIPTPTLLSNVKRILTLKDLKSILRSRTKMSGTKADLLMKLDRLLRVNDSNTSHTRQIDSLNDFNATNTRSEKNYKHMTVKQLRNELRLRGVKVSGLKMELIQRLTDIDTMTTQKSSENWHILSAVVSNSRSNLDNVHDVELPIFSTLLFVDKPTGMSTLPTKKVKGYPKFPCLSSLVKDWLYTHPDGIQLIQYAKIEEELYWNLTLAHNPSDTKSFRRKKRIREKMLEKELTFEPRPVHRLDIDTSGIVCIALTPYALRTAGMLYVALIEGEMRREMQVGHHEWACDIAGDESVAFCRPSDANTSNPMTFVDGSVREARTSYQVMNVSNNVTLVQLTPHTGRGHQLRLHMASLGYPIVGDSMHGDVNSQVDGEKLHLHASKLSIDCWKRFKDVHHHLLSHHI
eukprot:scaffold20499_cov67-Cyclotella_meneghiniana.AAC.3